MKDNLKTFPGEYPPKLTYDPEFGCLACIWVDSLLNWKVDFEDELRTRLDDATIIGMSDRPVSIREILGEEK